LFLLSALPAVILNLSSFILVIMNKKQIDRRHYFSLILFALPPFTAIALQIFFYGISIMLNCVVISLLIAYLNIQDHDMNTDHLTGIYNRKMLENYLKKKINRSNEKKTFSAIMLDINNFKYINDTFGHETGDKALETAAGILRSCIRSNDFIARFGGDEFWLILNITAKEDLAEFADRIRSCLDHYNALESSVFKLSFSMGYAVYQYDSHMGMEEFQKHIDNLMYEDKKKQKQEQMLTRS